MNENRQGRIPFEHALELYRNQHWSEIQQRINLPYDTSKGVFSLKLLGKPYQLSWPDGELTNSEGKKIRSYVIRILVLRYFALGNYVEPTGRKVTYKDIQDGFVYYSNFKKRTIDWLALECDGNPHLMDMDGVDPGLGDRSLEFEIIDRVPVTYICWEGDDEFPASANILFDETIGCYFNAEDLAVLPDLGIVWLKEKGVLPLDLGMYDPRGYD